MSVWVLMVVMTVLCADGGQELGVFATQARCEVAKAHYTESGERTGLSHWAPVYRCDEMKVEG